MNCYVTFFSFALLALLITASAASASKRVLHIDILKNADLPFVFYGVNNDASKYGYPFRYVTGMVEVAPVAKLVYKSRKGNLIINTKMAEVLGVKIPRSYMKMAKRLLN